MGEQAVTRANEPSEPAAVSVPAELSLPDRWIFINRQPRVTPAEQLEKHRQWRARMRRIFFRRMRRSRNALLRRLTF